MRASRGGKGEGGVWRHRGGPKSREMSWDPLQAPQPRSREEDKEEMTDWGGVGGGGGR